jgi:hypothetical protein
MHERDYDRHSRNCLSNHHRGVVVIGREPTATAWYLFLPYLIYCLLAGTLFGPQ